MTSPVVPFGELFAVGDTVYLDPSPVIGSVSVLDVSEQGEYLVTDHVGRGIHQYSDSGTYVRSYSPSECLPDEDGFMAFSFSRFLANGQVMTMNFSGSAVIFDEAGNCVAATRRLETATLAFCAVQDSIFVHSVYVEGAAAMGVYSPELAALDPLEIEPPRLVRLNQVFRGLTGTSVACFEDGPYYIYAESMDGKAARTQPSTTRYQPEYFERRPDESPVGPGAGTPLRRQSDYPTTVSVFALDGSTRMVVTIDLDEQWRFGGASAARPLGLAIANNTGLFPGRSTISPVVPRAAGNGYFYAVGDNEELSNGDVGNPAVVRYRFIPPN